MFGIVEQPCRRQSPDRREWMAHLCGLCPDPLAGWAASVGTCGMCVVCLHGVEEACEDAGDEVCDEACSGCDCHCSGCDCSGCDAARDCNC